MTGKRRDNPPVHAALDKTPSEDDHQAGMHAPSDAEESGLPDFVFDDRVIEAMQTNAAKHPPLDSHDAPGASDSGFDISGVKRSIDDMKSQKDLHLEAPASENRPETDQADREVNQPRLSIGPAARRGSPRQFLLIGGLLLLVVAVFVFRRVYFSARQAEVTAPPPVAVVAPVIVPPSIPTRKERRRTTRAIVVPPLKKSREAAKAAAPIVIPPAPKPAMPQPAVPATPVAPVQSAAPPPAVVEVAPVPAVVAPAGEILDEESWFKLAEEYLQMHDDKHAEAIYLRILNEGTQQGRAAIALGDLFAGRNDFNRAQEYYRSAKRRFQDRAQPTSPP